MSATLDLNNTFGAFLIGVVVSSALFGVTCTQMFHYFQNYPEDSIFFKGVVILLFICEALHSALAIHAIYYYTILNYANPEALLEATSSIILTVAISSLIIQIVYIFYARRVYYVSKKNIYLVGLIVAVSLGRTGTSIGVAVRAFQLKYWAEFSKFTGLIESGLGMAAVIDTIIAAALSYYLHHSRSGIKSTDTMINKLMVYAINNGILTSVFDILVVGFVAREPGNLIYLSIYQVIGNLYTNSMMATLNSRRGITGKNNSSSSSRSTHSTRVFGATEISSNHENDIDLKRYPIQITTVRDIHMA